MPDPNPAQDQVVPAPERQFWCFISYRHIDNRDQDRQWATWLQREMEHYEVPRELVGTLNKDGEEIPARIYPVFRDEEELSGGADLTAKIYDALDRARRLVVICSPRTGASTYVQQEILYFKSLGRDPFVYPAIIEGDPAAATPEEGACFPAALRFQVRPGTTEMTIEPAPESLAVDFRLHGREQGWTNPAAYRNALRKNRRGMRARDIDEAVADYTARLNLAKLKLIAGILGVDLGKLTERDKIHQLALARQRTRILRRWLAAVGVFAAAAVLAGSLAVNQRNHARRERDRAEQLSAWLEADKVESLFDSGAENEALPLLAHQLRRDPNDFLAAHRLISALTFADYHLPLLPPMSHQSRMSDPRFIREGRYLLTEAGAEYDSRVGLWDVATGKLVRSFRTREPLFWYDITADESQIALAPRSGHCRLVNIDSGETISPEFAVGPGLGDDPDLSPDGSLIALPFQTRCRVIRTRTGEELPIRAEGSSVCFCASFNPDASLLAVGSRDRIQVFTVSDWSKPYPDIPTGTDARELIFSADGLTLYANLERGGVRRFDSRTGREMLPAIESKRSVYRLKIFNQASVAVFSSHDGSHGAYVRPLDPGSEQLPDPFAHRATVSGFDLFLPKSLLLTGAGDHTALLWSTTHRRPLGAPMRHSQRVTGVAFHPSGNSVVTCGSDRTAVLWDIRPGNAQPLKGRCLPGPRSLHFDKDGKRLLLTTALGFQWFDAGLLTPLAPVVPFPGPRTAVRDFSASTGLLAIADDRDLIEMWDTTSGKRVWERHETNPVRQLSFSTNGNELTVFLASTPDDIRGKLIVRRAFDGDELFTKFMPPGQQAFVVAWNQSGERFATACSRTMTMGELYQTRDGTQLSNEGLNRLRKEGLKHAEPVTAYAFGPEAGGRMVTGSMDSTARIWSQDDGQPLTAPMQHEGGVMCVAFSPNGSLVATGTTDGQARVWTAQDGQAAGEPMLHGSTVRRVHFLDDRRILTLTDNREVRLWDSKVSQPLTPVLSLGKDFSLVTLSPANDRLAVANGGGDLQVWPLPSFPVPAPDWLPELAEAVGSSRINERGIHEHVPVEDLARIRKRWTGPASPKDSPYETWVRWFFADRDTRGPLPGASSSPSS